MDALRSVRKAMNASRALLSMDIDGVREFCLAMFDLDPGEHLAKQLCIAWQAERRGQWDTSCGPAIWMKLVLSDLWVLPAHGASDDVDERMLVTLHVFFLHLEETRDMLHLLRSERCDDEPRYARSKVSKSNLKIKPINALTEAVARWTWQARADGREAYMEPADQSA